MNKEREEAKHVGGQTKYRTHNHKKKRKIGKKVK
jgi:hypothetical protein